MMFRPRNWSLVDYLWCWAFHDIAISIEVVGQRLVEYRKCHTCHKHFWRYARSESKS